MNARLLHSLLIVLLLAGCRSEKVVFRCPATPSVVPVQFAGPAATAHAVAPRYFKDAGAAIPGFQSSTAVAPAARRRQRPYLAAPGAKAISLALAPSPSLALQPQLPRPEVHARRQAADPSPSDYTNALLAGLGLLAVAAAILVGAVGLATATSTVGMLTFGAILVAGLIPAIILLASLSPPAPRPQPHPAPHAGLNDAPKAPRQRLSKTKVGLLLIGGLAVLAPIIFLVLKPG